MAENRLNVFPSRMVLTSLKERVVAAKTGHSLLKRKSDAIKANLNLILKEILDVKRRLFKSTMREAAFAHTEATYYTGNFNHQVIDNTKQSSYRVRAWIKNVAGVKLPQFRRAEEDNPTVETMVGLASGGMHVTTCREKFSKALTDLVLLASLQTSLKTLDEALKITNRRVNALEFVVMPILENTMKYVISELDELEREDQFRIKKIKDIRVRQQDEEIALKKKIQILRNKAAQAAGASASLGAAGLHEYKEEEEEKPRSALDAQDEDATNPSDLVTDVVDTTD
jgi:V-type H+-transporting ATPase subunit D